MPVHKTSKGTWRIGGGTADYDTKASAERAYNAYLAKKHGQRKKMYPSHHRKK